MTAPSLRDPVGLLARSPELAALSERSPALRVAIERGRPHDAYRALFWAHKRGKLGELAGVGEALLQHRRIFFKPLTGSPVMFTYNGIGTSLYGREDLDPRDSTYVATLFAVFLFVPLFPLGSYLVRDAASGKRRAWTFMAKVPFRAATYFWQRGVAVAMLVLIAFGAAHAFEGYGHNTLHIVSGLDRAVRVELASAVNAASVRSEVLAAGGTVQIRAEVGKHALTIRDGDRVIESETVDVPRGRSALVWNVLGAAPVFVDHAVYVAEGKPEPDLPRDEPELLCGKAFLARDGIDDVFTDSPKHISMPEHTSTVTRTHLGVAPGGVSTCVRYLTATGRVAEAARFSLKVARAERLPAAKLTAEVRALITRAPLADAEAFAKALLAWDDSIEAHRVYQNVLTENGLRARAISEYEARLAARPNEPDGEYLALRVRPHADERSAIDPLVALYPTHPFLRRIQIYVHYADREHAQVLAASEALRGLDRSLWLDGLSSHVEALVALGRGEEAMALARDVASDASTPEPERRFADLLAYRVAHRTGSPKPTMTRPSDDDTFALELRATAGEELSSAEVELVKDPDTKGALRVARAAQSSPESAIALAREAGPRGMSRVPSSVQLLLLAEATRRPDASDLIPALAGENIAKHSLDPILAYVAGGPPADDLLELPLELRAAIELGRSRAPGLSAKERSLALERAKSSDVFRGPVSVAIAGWPP